MKQKKGKIGKKRNIDEKETSMKLVWRVSTLNAFNLEKCSSYGPAIYSFPII